MERLEKLEVWRKETVDWQQSMARWRAAVDKQTDAINSMIELFERIEGSLWLFVRIGNAIKWLAGFGTAVAALIYLARRHWT